MNEEVLLNQVSSISVEIINQLLGNLHLEDKPFRMFYKVYIDSSFQIKAVVRILEKIKNVTNEEKDFTKNFNKKVVEILSKIKLYNSIKEQKREKVNLLVYNFYDSHHNYL